MAKDTVKQKSTFTLSEVAECDGKEGRPAYFVFENKVFDVSDSPMWKNGVHMQNHRAGTNLTDQMAAAPHWGEVLTSENVREVGRLRSDQRSRCLPWGMEELCTMFPSMRRHPHPVATHFPVAYFWTAALFLVLSFFTPVVWGLDLERMAYLMVVLGTLFTLAAMATGFLTLWANYRFRTPLLVKKKIVLSFLLLAGASGCLYLGIDGPPPSTFGSILYHLLLLSVAGLTLVIGYLGGQMTFPTKVR